MRRGNLPDESNKKNILKTQKRPTNKASQQRALRRGGATLLGFSFGNYRRHRRDVLMGLGEQVRLTSLGDAPLEIYPNQLKLKLEHQSEHVTFLDFDTTIEDNLFVYKLFDKKEKFL